MLLTHAYTAHADERADMRIVVFGDSNIGGFADDRGGMGRALRKWAQESLGATPVEIVGVQGSSAGDWLGGIGVPGPGRAYGRWKKLTGPQRRKADLRRLRDLKADLYIAAFGSNDAVKYGDRRNEIYARNVSYITNFLNAPTVWLDNGVNLKTEGKKRPMVDYARHNVRDRRVYFAHSSSPDRQKPYLTAGGRAHPSWTVHYAFLRVAGPSAARWVRRSNINWIAIAAATGAVAGIGYMATPSGQRKLRRIKARFK